MLTDSPAQQPPVNYPCRHPVVPTPTPKQPMHTSRNYSHNKSLCCQQADAMLLATIIIYLFLLFAPQRFGPSATKSGDVGVHAGPHSAPHYQVGEIREPVVTHLPGETGQRATCQYNRRVLDENPNPRADGRLEPPWGGTPPHIPPALRGHFWYISSDALS
eukprot:2489578-Pyramimonas_sp.AAC.1